MTPEELDTALDQYRYPELRIDDTGANVVALQTWLRMLGHYHGTVSGRLDPATAQAVDDFRAQQATSGVPLPTPPGAVLARNTWEAMNDLLQHMLPPNPDTLDRRPLPHHSSFDSEAKYQKALMEGLRAFGFPVSLAAEPLRIPITVDASGSCTIHGLPPGEYEPSLSIVAPPTTGTVDLHLQASDGAPFHGRLRLASVDREYDLTATNGHAHLAGLPPGEYNLDVAHADHAEHLLSDTGSLSLHLRDAQGNPVAAVGYLMSAMPDSDSLQNAVRLLKALQRGLTVGLESGHRARLGQSLLSGSFDDTAHDYHARTWARFSSTWGRFYGAPWTGILFHPSDPLAANANDDLNWGTHQLITMLQQWGRAYLLASENEEDLLERLRRPIALHYLGRPLGGPIHQRRDFSQCGTDSSLHLQRVSSVIVDGHPTAVFHGGVDYLSPEYSPHLTARQLGPLLATTTDADITTPGDTLVDHLVAPQIRDSAPELIHDRRRASKTSNAKASFTRLIYRVTGHTGRRQANRAQLLAAAANESPNHAAIFTSADSALFTAHQLAQIESQLESPRQSATKLRLWEVFRCVQKALYWCKLLVSAGHHEKAREWSKRYLDRGWEGLFRAYEFIDSGDITPDLYFEFRDHDWTNLLQLEAIVEFYTNYNDPNRQANTFPRGTSREGVSVPRLPTVADKGDYDAFVDPQFKGSPKGLSAGLHLVQIDPFGARNNALGKIRAKSTPLRHISGSMYSITLPKPDQSIEHALTQQPPTLALWVRSSNTRASATYRITHATKGPDNKTYQLTLDTAPEENPGGSSPGPQPPSIPANAPWELIETNSWLTGTNAQMHLTDRNTIVLDVASTTINSHTDTIFLESDTARPSRTYRITSFSADASRKLVLDGHPSLRNGHSKWRIPAGAGGISPPLGYATTKLNNRYSPEHPQHQEGYDHYDGALFTVHNGKVISCYRFTSFTSHKRPNRSSPSRSAERKRSYSEEDEGGTRRRFASGAVDASSIRGNRAYEMTSAAAAGVTPINYAFSLGGTDTLDGARYYSAFLNSTPTPTHYNLNQQREPPGRTYGIFIHYGYVTGASGSAGCQVSPDFYKLRDDMIVARGIQGTTIGAKLHKLGMSGSEQLYDADGKGDGSHAAIWFRAVRGHYWLIRPQERALDNYDVINNYILNQQRRQP